MPFGVRDVLLVIRAKDQASGVILGVGSGLSALGDSSMALGSQMQGVGSGMLSMGAGLIGLGAIGVGFFAAATKSAIDFDTSTRMAWTQINQFKGNLEDVQKVILDVAQAIPVPFEQIGPALFDIFSSIPVANMEDAKNILIDMSKAAVAGATDIRTVARSNFEIINAYGLSIGDLNHLLDVQFKLVQIGIGSYADINAGIGRLAPTARIAGQTIDTMGGALAFMTRITGDGEQAITGVQRAMESITNPKVSAKFAELGVAVADSAGNFRPFKDIVNDLSGALSTMDPQSRSAAIFDLFRSSGSGSKNTRAFFNSAIENIGAFNDSMDAVADNAGAMQSAFDIMSGGVAANVETLSNDFHVLMISIGHELLPVVVSFTDKLVDVVTWFNNLDPGVRRTAVLVGAIGSAVALVSGIFLVFGGIILVTLGTMTVLLDSFALALVIFLAIPVAIAAIIGGLVYLVGNWNDVKAAVSDFATTAKQALSDFKDAAAADWDSFKKYATDRLAELVVTLKQTWEDVKKPWQDLLDSIKDNTKTTVKDTKAFLDTQGPGMWDSLKNATTDSWHQILSTIDPVIKAIIGWFQFLADVGSLIWREFHGTLFDIVKATWDLIVGVIGDAVGIITGIVKLFADIFNGDWGKAWDDVKQIFSSAWDIIVANGQAAVDILGTILGSLGSIGLEMAGWILNGLETGGVALFWWFVALPGNTLKAVGTLLETLKDKGIDLITGLFTGITDHWTDVTDWLSSIDQKAFDAVSDLLETLKDKGSDLITGMIKGLEAAGPDFVTWLKGLPQKSKDATNDAITWLTDTGKDVIKGIVNGAVDEVKAIQKFLTGDLPAHMSEYVKMADTWIRKDGAKALEGFLKGIGDKLQDVLDWLSKDLPQHLADAVTNAKKWLEDGGYQTIEGFLKGLYLALPLIILFFVGLPLLIAATVLAASLLILLGIGQWIVERIAEGIIRYGPAVLNWFVGLPMRLMAMIIWLGGEFAAAGRHIIDSIISGIESSAGKLTTSFIHVIAPLTNFLPKSPVKKGPLMALNDGAAGKNIIRMITAGIEAEMPNLNAAMAGIGNDFGNIGFNVSGPQGGGSGGPGGSNWLNGSSQSIIIAEGAITIHDARDPEAVAKTVRTQMVDLIYELQRR